MQDQGDGESRADDSPVGAPRIPEVFLDPRPVLLVGTIAWTLALLVVMLTTDADVRSMVLCAVGVGVGAAGWLVYSLQRRAVLRGSAGAQAGINVPPEQAAGEETRP